MNINQLKYFVTVAEEMNFTRAAEKLYISQPSLSQSIQLLEREFGVEFFTRKPLKLTYAGEIFVEWAKKVLLSSEQLQQKIYDVVESKDMKLIIGMSPYRSTYILPPVVAKFRKEYPYCKIILEEHPSDMLKNFIDDDKVDLLIDIPSYDTYSYCSVPVAEEKILLAVPANWCTNKFISLPYVNLSELKDKPFIFLTKKQQIGKISRTLCSECGFEPDIAIECHNIETAYSMVVAGLGVSFIPELFARHSMGENSEKVMYYEIKDFYPKREIAVIYNKNKYLTNAASRFIELLKETI